MFGFGKKDNLDYGSLIVEVDGRLEVLPIDEEAEGTVKAGEILLPVTEGKEYFSRAGERFLVFRLSLPALVEAEKVAKIRESEVLKGLFEVPEPKKLLDYVPMFILGLVAVLALFLGR